MNAVRKFIREFQIAPFIVKFTRLLGMAQLILIATMGALIKDLTESRKLSDTTLDKGMNLCLLISHLDARTCLDRPFIFLRVMNTT